MHFVRKTSRFLLIIVEHIVSLIFSFLRVLLFKLKEWLHDFDLKDSDKFELTLQCEWLIDLKNLNTIVSPFQVDYQKQKG